MLYRQSNKRCQTSVQRNFYTHWNKTLYLAFWWRQKCSSSFYHTMSSEIYREVQLLILKLTVISKQKMIAAFKKSGQLRTCGLWNECFWSSLGKWRGKFNHRSQRRERLTGVTWLTLLFCTNQTPTCFPCLLSSLASLVLIVEPNPSPLCSLECEIMCFTKYSGSVIVYTHYVMRWVATRLTAVPVLIIRLCLLQK